MYRKDEVVRSLWSLIEANLDRHRIELVQGYAAFEDPHTRAGRATWTAACGCSRAPVILIATGSYPNWPEGVAARPRAPLRQRLDPADGPHPGLAGRGRRPA